MTDTIITIITMGVVTVGLIVWDLYVYFGNDEPDDSISHWMRKLGGYTSMIPFGWGVLGGHFFWPGTPLFGSPTSFIVLWVGGGLLSIPEHFVPAIKNFEYRLLTAFVVGVVGGAVLWPL